MKTNYRECYLFLLLAALILLISVASQNARGSILIGYGINTNNQKATYYQGRSYFAAWQSRGDWAVRAQVGALRYPGWERFVYLNYAGAALMRKIGPFDVGVGVMYGSRETWNVSERINALLIASLHVAGPLRVTLQHISDARTGGVNRGANMFMLAVQF